MNLNRDEDPGAYALEPISDNTGSFNTYLPTRSRCQPNPLPCLEKHAAAPTTFSTEPVDHRASV